VEVTVQDWLDKMMPDPEKWAEQFAAHPVVSRPIVMPMGEPLTDEQLDHLKAEWERKRHGHPKVIGLPRRVRFSLAVTHAIDAVAIWFADHGCLGVAEWIWWRR
jgi:hypothetical protein